MSYESVQHGGVEYCVDAGDLQRSLNMVWRCMEVICMYDVSVRVGDWGVVQELGMQLVRECYSKDMCLMEVYEDPYSVDAPPIIPVGPGAGPGTAPRWSSMGRRYRAGLVGACVLLAYKYVTSDPKMTPKNVLSIMTKAKLDLHGLTPDAMVAKELNVLEILGWGVQRPSIVGLCRMGLRGAGCTPTRKEWDCFVCAALCSHLVSCGLLFCDLSFVGWFLIFELRRTSLGVFGAGSRRSYQKGRETRG